MSSGIPMIWRLIFAAAMTEALSSAAAWPAAAGDDVIVENLTLPAQFKGAFGRIEHDDLEAMVVRPNDGKPHPLALINHGMTSEPDQRHEMRPSDMEDQAEQFALRGWTALIPMRRDYGKSGGEFAEDITGQYCGSLGYDDEGRASAQDLKEAVRLISAKPYVDPSKVISVGVSGGGFATVALTADPPPNLVAGINFAGGEGSSEHGMYCSFNELVQAFGTFGRKSKVPMLWVYAENDHFFSPGLAREFVKAFNDAGGHAEFIMSPPFGNEGHYLFTYEGIPIWTKYVDDFLAKHNLTMTAANSEKASR